ncbi:MAG: GNAT family N-acetyltransferase [Faecalibacterium sp.]|nr:GNAT family N-acetyltransferase [Ruminococcus sp.]MCM1391680.1 GNAT family N-acetyltransferase [Ruminococcus sp.]MCM1485978.1 GNAT family N-acetyltransferase [Faecalibacterium sp.]
MLIKSEEKYIEQLTKLWHDVFDDDEEYIKLFFDTVYKNSKTFAHFDGEKIVSVFYLLDCKIRYESCEYKGFYLYAAATDPDYRKRGLMSDLIEQAKQYCRDSNVSFISLVPGNEPLYAYYSKLGFQTAMYKNIVCINEKSNKQNIFVEADVDDYLKIRNTYNGNCFLWNKDELSYVFDCFDYCGIHAYRDKKCCVVADKKNHRVNELICDKLCLSETVEKLSGFFCGKEFTIETPYNIGERIKFGMICPIDAKLNREWSADDIYMNFALD